MYNSLNTFDWMKTKTAETEIFHVLYNKIDVQTMRNDVKKKTKKRWETGFGSLRVTRLQKLCNNISTKSLYAIYSGWSIDNWINRKQYSFILLTLLQRWQLFQLCKLFPFLSFPFLASVFRKVHRNVQRSHFCSSNSQEYQIFIASNCNQISMISNSRKFSIPLLWIRT